MVDIIMLKPRASLYGLFYLYLLELILSNIKTSASTTIGIRARLRLRCVGKILDYRIKAVSPS